MNNIELENKISDIIHELSDKKGIISTVDVLIRLGYLSPTDYENWRFGRIEYIEKVCHINLGKLTTINRIIRQTAKKMNLKPSLTVYNKYGKGPKIKLRFSKSGEKSIEKAYSTHYINTYQISKLLELKNKSVTPEDEKI